MDELYERLNKISDSYFAFVLGIVSYVKMKPSRLDVVLTFLRDNENAKSSDVVKFISEQPDFNEFNLGLKEKVG